VPNFPPFWEIGGEIPVDLRTVSKKVSAYKYHRFGDLRKQLQQSKNKKAQAKLACAFE
jgi:hypothetical protein